MQNREVVRLAYNLILGREPENEDVLERTFNDVFDLRESLFISKYLTLPKKRWKYTQRGS